MDLLGQWIGIKHNWRADSIHVRSGGFIDRAFQESPVGTSPKRLGFYQSPEYLRGSHLSASRQPKCVATRHSKLFRGLYLAVKGTPNCINLVYNIPPIFSFFSTPLLRGGGTQGPIKPGSQLLFRSGVCRAQLDYPAPPPPPPPPARGPPSPPLFYI